MGAVATLMLHGGANIPTVNTMGCPGAAAVWQFMNDNTVAGGAKRGLVEIKCIMELCIIGQAWVGEVSLEKVQSNEGLGKNFIPKMQGKIGINAADGCNEFFFQVRKACSAAEK